MYIYTDGSCLGNPGRGGWGFIMYGADGEVYRHSGNALMTTNNVMELTAMDQALESALHTIDTDHVLHALHDGCEFHIYTDSKYVKQGMSEWIKKWKHNNFKTATGKDVKNQYLWVSIDQKMELLGDKTYIHWVRAHDGNERNETVDHLARHEAESVK